MALVQTAGKEGHVDKNFQRSERILQKMIEEREKQVDIQQYVLDKEVDFFDWYESSSTALDQKILKDIQNKQLSPETVNRLKSLQEDIAQLENQRKQFVDNKVNVFVNENLLDIKEAMLKSQKQN